MYFLNPLNRQTKIREVHAMERLPRSALFENETSSIPLEEYDWRQASMNAGIVKTQLEAAAALRDRLNGMTFAAPVSHVYNPFAYAWNAFEEYVTRYGCSTKRVLFLGMNPGPWGMAQTGVPFGEITAVKDWLCISAPIGRPGDVQPGYPVDGYSCKRSEVSGKRLWGFFKERFGPAEKFFERNFVANYCPLLFIETYIPANGKERARNLTPDKLGPKERVPLQKACDAHLRAVVEALEPLYVVGVGAFAARRAEEALAGTAGLTIAKILHPSPASPKSNSGWSGEAARQLAALDIWQPA
jgi:single-strand selective monofunctional uracil DNA glycosylase